jgi:protein TonB
VLGYVVNADGTVGDIEVLEANPVQVFTRIATNALASWRFTPTGASERRQVEFRFIAG